MNNEYQKPELTIVSFEPEEPLMNGDIEIGKSQPGIGDGWEEW